MTRLSRIIALFVALPLLGCGPASAPAHRMGASAPPTSGRTVNFDPSVVGLPAAINTTVYDSQGVISWLKYGTSNTAWRPIPVTQIVTSDPSQAPGLKAPLGFPVTMFDGSQSWIKSTSSDTGWVINPVGVATPSTAGLAPAKTVFPFEGTALADADATINPGTDKASQYTESGVRAANHVLTLGTGGTPGTNDTVSVSIQSTGAFTYTVKDDAATTLFTVPSNGTKMLLNFYWNGTHYVFLSRQWTL